jgi:hypothetical protein
MKNWMQLEGKGNDGHSNAPATSGKLPDGAKRKEVKIWSDILSNGC